MSETENDLTIVYYTAMNLPGKFAKDVLVNLANITQGIKMEMVIQDKNTPRSHLQIYRNALEGARKAKTKYIALCEDDVLYSPDHFKHRPSPGKFAYNISVWSLYTWSNPPVFSWKNRRNLGQLICERDLFIEAMEERFNKLTPEIIEDQRLDENWFVMYWAEPGKYENFLRVTRRETEEFYSEPPNIAFSHETALSFRGLGTRKKLGHLRSLEVPYWGKASDIVKLYG